MKVTYTIGNFQVEAEGSTTEVFEQLASFDSVFGNCKNKANDSTNIGFRHREVDGNHYYEMVVYSLVKKTQREIGYLMVDGLSGIQTLQTLSKQSLNLLKQMRKYPSNDQNLYKQEW